jgi:hypothetical protein
MKRSHALICVALTIALGIASRKVHLGFMLWDKSLGDVLYTVMVYFFVALARPSLRPVQLGVIALVISVAIECFQATGIPARSPRIFQIVLGTYFSWHDMACYVVGAALVTLGHLAMIKRQSRAGAS